MGLMWYSARRRGEGSEESLLILMQSRQLFTRPEGGRVTPSQGTHQDTLNGGYSYATGDLSTA